MKNKILIIAGPTGVGKTNLSIQLAQKLNGEIISSDSMQIYKGMDIGTAKITEEEMQGIPHHLIDVISPLEKFTVFDFKQRSEILIKEITSRGKLPMVVGGTGLYINTLLYDMDFNDSKEDPQYRKELWDYYNKFGEDALYERLLEVDKKTKIEKGNTKRIIRALEIYKTQGTIQVFDQMKERQDIDPTIVILTRNREELYQNINMRVDKMLEEGLLEEVRFFYERGLDDKYQSMKAIGYLQLIRYFQGVYSFDEAVEKIKQESRRYAKRQITWFKRYNNAIWIDLSEDSTNDFIKSIKL